MKNKVIKFLFSIIFCFLVLFGFSNTLYAEDFNTITVDPNSLSGGLGKNDTSWQQISQNIIGLLAWVAGTALLAMLLIGGVMFITSAGNEEQAEKAKKLITNAIIGITVVAVSYGLVLFIANTFK